MFVSKISFNGQPKNYLKIDNFLSRSAQPSKDDFIWLKAQGVTDVFNFRTMFVSAVDFDEKAVVESLGMKYHSIPSVTAKPTKKNVKAFLKELNQIKKSNGKAHIHCWAGADRTGMYAYIYKALNAIDSRLRNQLEMIYMGHNIKKYPKLLPWTNDLINKLLKIKLH